MYHFVTESQLQRSRRASIAWNLLLASAILILPVVVLLPLAYYWRSTMYRTVFISHFRAVIRYAWLIFLAPLVAALVPWNSVGLVIALMMLFIALFAAIEGRRAVARGTRYNGFLT